MPPLTAEIEHSDSKDLFDTVNRSDRWVVASVTRGLGVRLQTHQTSAMDCAPCFPQNKIESSKHIILLPSDVKLPNSFCTVITSNCRRVGTKKARCRSKAGVSVLF
ncbi:hypothetical protein GOODEAATRI_020792 [Goodea atripinnis]|uniref:Uncharacterized protein n=1 Tax=Goodea atripinnis TaxID=208336 RepID=A0ABV0PFR7_9TELE